MKKQQMVLWGMIGFALFLIPGGWAKAETLDHATTVVIGVADPSRQGWDSSIDGLVTDSEGKTLSNVSLVLDGVESRADAQGLFHLTPRTPSSSLLLKKPGYRKALVKAQKGGLRIALQPQEIRGLYLQAGLVRGQSASYQSALRLLRETELNAVVIDVKDDGGHVSTGLNAVVADLHLKGIYTIARIVTFKDNEAPRRHPEMAIVTNQGGPWADHHNTTYLNPYNPAAWNYVIQIARTAVAQGFDEVQFDYVRFPTDGNRSTIAWSREFTSASRTAAIAGFLADARQQLGAMGAFVAADVFGITAYTANDSGIGQQVEDVTKHLDYICPMEYPSGFSMGAAGLGTPVDHPGEIVHDSVRRYRLRADNSAVVRPWLQAFRDYAFNHRDYGGPEIRAQIEGDAAAGGAGFMLWNAGSRYTEAGLKAKSRGALALRNY